MKEKKKTLTEKFEEFTTLILGGQKNQRDEINEIKKMIQNDNPIDPLKRIPSDSPSEFGCEINAKFTTFPPIDQTEQKRRLMSASEELKALLEKYEMSEIVGRIIRIYKK